MHMFRTSSSKSKQLQRLNKETAAAQIASILRLRLQLTLKLSSSSSCNLCTRTKPTITVFNRLFLEEMYKNIGQFAPLAFSEAAWQRCR